MMFLSALSPHSAVLRALPVFAGTAAGMRAPLPARYFGSPVGLHPAQRTFSAPKWHILGPAPRTLTSNRPSSPGQLIYTGSLGAAVKGVKAFSYSTSGASVLLMPHILLNTGLGAHSWPLQAVFCAVVGFFTFLTPVMLHLITKGYVVRLYHEPTQDLYTAVTYSVLLTEKKTVFHQTQVRLPDVSKMFTTFYADGTGLLVNPDLFTVPQHYNHLMGYDKPFSFCPDELDKS